MTTVSWSQLRTFLECGWRWQKKYVDGIVEKERKSAAAEYGSKMHDELLNKRTINIPFYIVGTEVYVSVPYSEIMLNGVIDVLAMDKATFIDDREFIIVDVKTYQPDKIDFMQLNFYAFIMRIKKQPVARIYIYQAQEKQLIKAPDMQDEVQTALDKLLAQMQNNNNKVVPSAGKHCRFCGYVEICPLQRNIWANTEMMTEEEVFKLYLYIQELEKRLTDKLKEFAKDHEVKYGQYVATIEKTKAYKLKPVEKEQIYNKYRLDAFQVDKEFLKQAEPSLFEVVERETLKIKEDE